LKLKSKNKSQKIFQKKYPRKIHRLKQEGEQNFFEEKKKIKIKRLKLNLGEKKKLGGNLFQAKSKIKGKK
jgi:hypothetical protein